MPSRPIIALILLGWLATIGWVAYDRWLPWLRPSEQPAFVLDLADEVAPQNAIWTLYRKDQRIGGAETRIAPLKDGTFEMTHRLRETEIKVSLMTVKINNFVTTKVVNHDGELIRLSAVAKVDFKALGTTFKVDTKLNGTVVGNTLEATCDFDSDLGKATEKLDPIPLTSKRAESPLQPLHRFPELRPGQTWREANIDPVNEALNTAIERVVNRKIAEQFGGRLPFKLPTAKTPRELLAEVQAEPETITHRDKSYVCHVIVYKAEGFLVKTWVQIEDGKVIRQEASLMDDKLMLQRE
ncbi:hypothetical protein [Zavarzinella formosa]|uniref:hypothetical protein n=1 Tax=Zavarzinella formosa TaxID=360055 RepID=UPI00031A02FC|nr:hypothetical protein [Zavarzinella formosa]